MDNVQDTGYRYRIQAQWHMHNVQQYSNMANACRRKNVDIETDTYKHVLLVESWNSQMVTTQSNRDEEELVGRKEQLIAAYKNTG